MDQPATVTAPRVVTDTSTRLAPQYRVLLHNDDVNDMDYVMDVLVRVFCMGSDEAMDIMLTAHNEGVSLIRVEPLEHAELHRDQMQSAGLTTTIEAT